MPSPAPLPGYAELHCLSNFSFQRGASHPKELVARAAQLGYQALALTDECSVAGVVRAWEAAKECGLHLIVGSEFVWGDLRLVALARDAQGWGNLCEFITAARAARPSSVMKLLVRRCAVANVSLTAPSHISSSSAEFNTTCAV